VGKTRGVPLWNWIPSAGAKSTTLFMKGLWSTTKKRVPPVSRKAMTASDSSDEMF
jgi:hypothetical protein